jgi:hypothetical protein
MPAQERTDHFRVGDVAADELAGQHRLRLARGEVVQHDRVKAFLAQVAHHVRPDVAGPARDQNGLAGGGHFLFVHDDSI